MRHNEDILSEYRNKYVNLHGFAVLFISLLEVAVYFLLHIDKKHPLSITSTYLWFFVVVPVFINITTHMVVRIINNDKSATSKTKNATLVVAALNTAAIVSLFHREYMATACAFAFPIVFSGIFNNKKLLHMSFNITVFVLLLVTYFNLRYDGFSINFIINHLVIYGINIVSYLSAKLMIAFSNSNLTVIKEQQNANKELKLSIQRDPMTGLYNHKTFYQKLNSAIKDYNNSSTPFCLTMLDIDDFKKFNDTYGHDEGDKVLLNLVSKMKVCCAENDQLCRFGGEEFVIIFKGKTIKQAKETTERILSQFSSSIYDFTVESTTFSAGIVAYEPGMSINEIFDLADSLMYAAKRNGKNQVMTGM